MKNFLHNLLLHNLFFQLFSSNSHRGINFKTSYLNLHVQSQQAQQHKGPAVLFLNKQTTASTLPKLNTHKTLI